MALALGGGVLRLRVIDGGVRGRASLDMFLQEIRPRNCSWMEEAHTGCQGSNGSRMRHMYAQVEGTAADRAGCWPRRLARREMMCCCKSVYCCWD